MRIQREMMEVQVTPIGLLVVDFNPPSQSKRNTFAHVSNTHSVLFHDSDTVRSMLTSNFLMNPATAALLLVKGSGLIAI